jgi:uncharacterized protein
MTSTIERRAIRQPQRQDDYSADLGRTIEGYAAVFYDRKNPNTEYALFSDAWERIQHGAFDRALKEMDDAAALWNHNSDKLLGRVSAGTCRLSVDNKGLKYVVDLPPNCDYADSLISSLKRGDCNRSSFSFTIDDELWRESKDAQGNVIFIREILSVRLIDVSPVCFPAYAGTSCSLRCADTPSDGVPHAGYFEHLAMQLQLAELGAWENAPCRAAPGFVPQLAPRRGA